jgi:hypothetical protein
MKKQLYGGNFMIINPYLSEGIWLKGNLHTHTLNSQCGHYPLQTVIDMYKSYQMKYDFLSITDHCTLTKLQDEFSDDIILFQGVEFKITHLQTLGINIHTYEDDERNYENHQELFDQVSNNNGINIICHPHVYNDDYWPFEKLIALSNYTGIEIYNNNVKFDNKGRAVATDLWDKLLSSGKKIFGFANDDMHIFQRCGGAFNMALCSNKSPESILNSLKCGSFYASTGIYLDSIKTDSENIFIELSHKNIPAQFLFIGNEGKLLKQCSGTSASYSVNGNENYIRIEVKREDGAMAWTQPFWIE